IDEWFSRHHATILFTDAPQHELVELWTQNPELPFFSLHIDPYSSSSDLAIEFMSLKGLAPSVRATPLNMRHARLRIGELQIGSPSNLVLYLNGQLLGTYPLSTRLRPLLTEAPLPERWVLVA